MSQKNLINSKLQKWREWMAVIEPEIRLLLRDARVFWEIQIIIHGHQRTQNFHYGYLERSYLDHALVRLHQQIKPYKGQISFVGLLREIAKNLDESSATFHDSIRLDPNNTQAPVSCTAVISTPICPQMVTEAITQLTSALELCQRFADERFVYWQTHESTSIPQSKEFNACFKLLDKTYVKYHKLFYGDGLKTLQPPRQAGTLKRFITMSDDFDADLPEFAEYMW